MKTPFLHGQRVHQIARLALAASLLLAMLAGGRAEGSPADWPEISLTLVAEGLHSPTAIAFSPDGSGRLFIGSTNGRIWMLRGDDPTPREFVNINHRGQGCRLFGLAFSPTYASDGSFYVHCLDRDTGQVVIARYQVWPGDPDRANPDSRQEVLRVRETAVMHSGGQLAFGPDGYLYAAVGDGDFNNDPENDAQNLGNLLGKVLRIDVRRNLPEDPPAAAGLTARVWLPAVRNDSSFTYTVPPTNPFVGVAGRQPEIWAYGLRNPWRFAFDRQTGDLFIADVGQSRREEINFQPAGSPGGQNYGWRVVEGSLCFNPVNCDPSPFTPPVAEYPHSNGDCAVIGGEVYRGSVYPQLSGIYLYGDHCTGRLWGLRRVGQSWQSQPLLTAGFRFSDIGDDAAGTLYVTDFDLGRLYKVVAQ